MQTKRNQPAKTTTIEQFVDHMKQMQTKGEKLCSVKPNLFKDNRGLLYSYDNPIIHNSEDTEELLEQIGILQTDRVHLPKYSPDFHKVIEHVHGWLKRKFREKLLQEPDLKPEDYPKVLFQCFNELSAKSVALDVESLLNELYPAVIDADGDWVLSYLR